MEKAGLVVSAEGVRGGYRLARSARQISILDVVDAIEGRKPLFQCREVRGKCALFSGSPPKWATRGMCAIHATMREAEARMRQALQGQTLADLNDRVTPILPAKFTGEAQQWFEQRHTGRHS
jgi:Rrf2 family protein